MKHGWLVFVAISIVSAGWGKSLSASVSLSGTWRFALDKEGQGISQEWFKRVLPETIQLPGTLQEQGFGDEVSTATPWMSRLHDKHWYLRVDYERYAQPGNIKIPFWLQPERHYIGWAWYQRDIEIPAVWQGRRVVLTLERPHWSTTVWLDEKQIGFNDGLSAPHIYPLGLVSPGRHRLTICVDNRMLQDIREDAHSITDSTQTNWNGLIGTLSLTSTTPVWIDDVRAFSDIETKTVHLKVWIGNMTGKAGSGTLYVNDKPIPVQWTAEAGYAEADYPLGDSAALWDEFHPSLHRLTLKLTGQQADDQRELTVGLRQIKAEGGRFYLNGRRVFFRGTHEGCQFPLTGYPPTDVESWRKIFKICKDYGLNHMRFHSWCPPEAAFTAADEMGIYLQPECSNWGQYSSRDTRLVEWLERETERIIRAYGNHPSFVLFSTGNEPAGPWQEPLLKWCRDWKARDNRRLYASQTGRFFAERPGPVPDIDYLDTMRIGSYMFRGATGWFGSDFSRSLEGTTYPVISHETGQWCVYPDFSEIPKYTGKLKPKNFEIFRDSLAEHGMLDQAGDFLLASGKLQAACYKEEIEALLRTPGMGGFQLLDLHDYPGQGTALVGILNVFWESKGYITPSEFRRFCNATVPLARMKRQIYTTAEQLNVDCEIAHFGAQPLQDVQPFWKIVDSGGKEAAGGQFERKTITVENAIPLGTVSISLGSLKAPAKYRLVVGLLGMEIENDWEFWLYPAQLDTAVPQDVVLTRSFEAAAAALQKGQKVLLMPTSDQLQWQSPPIGRLPIFWNRLMGPGWERFLGLVCQPSHPALAFFPTDEHYDWQWQDVFSPACRAVNIDALPKTLKPIVQMIDDWNRNYKLAAVFECRVGSGRLLVCAADLESNLDRRPAARQLRRSLLDYMGGSHFNPSAEISLEQLEGLHFDNRIMKKLQAAVTASMQNPGNPASNILDGNPNTYWLAGGRGQGHPYELAITFPQAVALKGLVWMNRQNHREHEGDVRDYRIEISSDGQNWTLAAQGQLKSTFHPQTIDFGKTTDAGRIKIHILSGFGGDSTASVADVAVLYAGPKLADDGSQPSIYQKQKTATEEIFEGPIP
ncbi:MAG: discoidin domain-containing protein [Phycisphaerae bacterium]|nr:discoidin domain-containing protein [Phycisphaerae bacterium]